MDLDRAVAELDALVQTLEREGDERALHLLELVDAVHRPGVAAIAEGDLGDPAVSALLAMYGYGVEEELLAEEALDEVRPYIESHGGEVQLVDVASGVVRVRLSGACVGCAGSAMTLRRGVEEALRARMPGFRELVAEEAQPEPALLQIAPLRRPRFEEVAREDAVEPGRLRAVEAAGVGVLLARVGGEVYALRNGCAVDGLPLEGSRLTDDGVIICPWHNCAYDARTGKRVDEPGEPGLGVLPVAVQDGALKVAVGAG